MRYEEIREWYMLVASSLLQSYKLAHTLAGDSYFLPKVHN